MTYEYKTKGTCSSRITFDLDGDVVTNIKFTGGCNGNLKRNFSFVDGMTVEEISKKLDGITCGFKNTSCPDQLAKAVTEAYKESQK